MYQYQLYPETSIAILRFNNTSAEEILESLHTIQQDPLFSAMYIGIVDMRNANTNIDPEEISKVSDYVNGTSSFKNKWALLVASPKETANSFIYQNQVTAHEIQVFSSIEGVSNYFRMDIQALLDF